MGICESGHNRPFEEEVPDLEYDFLIKKDDQKDGLDIYKPKSIINYSSQIKCPLCKYKLSQEEYLIIDNILNIGNENEFFNLIYEYNKEASRIDILDNINILESIYIKIKNYSKILEKNRYYKHKCQRINNQEIYIDIFYSSIIYNFDKELNIDINKLRTDENYKLNYINNKRNEYIKYTKKKKKIEIENQYINQFEEKNFQKEKHDFERITMMIQHLYENEKERQPKYDNNPYLVPIDMKPDPLGIYLAHECNFRFSITKKKLKEFIEDLTNEKIYDYPIVMYDWEKEEFKKFILERESEYYDYLNID